MTLTKEAREAAARIARICNVDLQDAKALRDGPGAALGHAAAVSCLNRIERENQRLRAAVEAAPHAPGCLEGRATYYGWDPCTCWKAAALENATALHRAGNDETTGET